MSFIKVFLLKAFSSLFGYKGVINTQINVYNRLKKQMPEAPENELLNKLITSRTKAWPRAGSRGQEQEYYAQFLENPNKTLEDVIWAIIDYEFILSRAQEAIIKGQQMGLTMDEIVGHWHDFEARVKGEIRESIKRKVGRRS